MNTVYAITYTHGASVKVYGSAKKAAAAFAGCVDSDVDVKSVTKKLLAGSPEYGDDEDGMDTVKVSPVGVL